MLIKQIYEGWKNDLFPAEAMKDVIEQVYQERIAICKSCVAYSTNGDGCAVPFSSPCCNYNVEVVPGVKGCGCPLKKKLKCLSCSCPANKWQAVISEKQEQEINGSKI